MDLAFLAQADAVTLRLEKAKRALEAAKVDLDSAKQAYDELLAISDEHGIPKAKLKRLTEERVNALFDIGMIEMKKEAAPVVREPKEPKPKKAKKAVVNADVSESSADEMNQEMSEWSEENMTSEADAGHA